MKIIDLFSGIGGFSLGFQKAGYQFTEHYFSEIDKHAIANYKYNFPHAKYIGDITTLHGGDFTNIDIITFGSPCQDFSLAGKREGLKGSKSSLIEYAIALIADIRPSIFIWENVKGAFSSNAGADFWAIIQAFANIGGYRLEFQLLNTKWLLPQNRERIYLIGHLAGRSIPGVFPITEDDKLLDRKAREKGWRGRNFKTSLARTITARYSKMGSNDTYIVPKIAATLTGGGHSGGLHSDMTIIQINPSTESNGRQPYQQNRVFDERGISPALTRHNSNYAISRMRRLTEIECERLQGFPSEIFINEENIIMTATEKNKLIKKAIDEGYIVVEGDKIYRTRLKYGTRGKELLIGSNRNGYIVSSLHIDGIKIQVSHHRIIWIYYNGLYDAENLCINHIDENKANNTITNLEVVTFAENSSKSTKNRLPSNQKITLEKAILIHRLWIEKVSALEIAKQVGVSKSTIYNVLKEEGWTKYGNYDGNIKPIARTQRYKLIGNAVTVDIVELIAKRLKFIENENNPRTRPAYPRVGKRKGNI